MNQGLSTVDLGRLLEDEQSFLGQTLRMGIGNIIEKLAQLVVDERPLVEGLGQVQALRRRADGAPARP